MLETPPVLFLVFNRPDTTKRVFEAIRAARPAWLYVAADGPRPDRIGETERAAEVRRIATEVDWPCEVHTLFRETNLGCRDAVSSAITWFFEHEPEGIILEDDCLPDPSFFPYCADLLARYRDDPRVMMVSGDNFQKRQSSDGRFHFSHCLHIWGWATWKRAWAHYDKNLSTFDLNQAPQVLNAINTDQNFIGYWQDALLKTQAGEINTWDYQWVWTCWRLGGLSCAPGVNLISNVGFGADATHTMDEDSASANLTTGSIQFPLRPPRRVAPDVTKDAYTFRHHFGIVPRTWRFKINGFLRRVLKRLAPNLLIGNES